MFAQAAELHAADDELIARDQLRMAPRQGAPLRRLAPVPRIQSLRRHGIVPSHVRDLMLRSATGKTSPARLQTLPQAREGLRGSNKAAQCFVRRIPAVDARDLTREFSQGHVPMSCSVESRHFVCTPQQMPTSDGSLTPRTHACGSASLQ